VLVTEGSIRFKVASMNVRRHDWAQKRCGSWAEALEALSSWTKRHEPDVFCFQQLPHEFFHQVAAFLSMQMKAVRRSWSPDHDDGCAVMWNPMSFRLDAAQAFSLSSSPSQIGTRLISQLEPRAGQVVALNQADFVIRAASCHWEPSFSDQCLGVLAAAARGRSGEILAALLGPGFDLDEELATFSLKTRGMPSLIAGGFEEASGIGIGRSVLEDAGFRPLIGLEHLHDDIYASPAIKVLSILDTGGLDGDSPMLVEVEMRDRQDYGARVTRDPQPSDVERHLWPLDGDYSESDRVKPDDQKAGIK